MFLSRKAKIKKYVNRYYIKHIFGELHDIILSEHKDAGNLKFIYVVTSDLFSPFLDCSEQLDDWLQAKKDENKMQICWSRSQEAARYAAEIIEKLKSGNEIDVIVSEIESEQITKVIGIAQEKQELEKILTEMCVQEDKMLSKIRCLGQFDPAWELSFYDELAGDRLILQCAIIDNF